MIPRIFSIALTVFGFSAAWGNLPVVEWDTTSSDVFVIDTRPAGGPSDTSSSLASFVLDTQDGLDVGEFYLEGPASISSGQTGTYQIYLRNPTSGQISNISNQARLRLQGGAHPNVGIGGKTVFAYDVDTPKSVTLYATYQRTDGQVASTPFALSLLPQGLQLAASSSKTNLGSGIFQINLSAQASGGSGGYSYAWDTDGDGNYNDAAGTTTSVTRSTTGIHTFRVIAADSLGSSSDALTGITLNKPLAPDSQSVKPKL